MAPTSNFNTIKYAVHFRLRKVSQSNLFMLIIKAAVLSRFFIAFLSILFVCICETINNGILNAEKPKNIFLYAPLNVLIYSELE